MVDKEAQVQRNDAGHHGPRPQLPAEDFESQNREDFESQNREDFESQNRDHSTPPLQTVPSTRGTITALGSWNIVLFTVSTAAIFGSLGLLCFIWFGHGNNTVWRLIILKNWIFKAITILTSVADTAVIIQIAICTSMLAALALEDREVNLSHLAALSALRGSNAGPQSLLNPVRKGLNRTPRKFALLLVLLVLYVMAILFRFASTVLLLDIAPLLIPGDPISSDMRYSTDVDGIESFPINLFSLSTYWDTKVPFYPTFAEFSEPSYHADGLGDTGRSLRALLPIATSSSRELLRNYSGSATLVDTRVVCIRPAAALHLDMPNTTETPAYIWGSISSTRLSPRVVNYTNSSDQYGGNGGPYGIPINCSIPFDRRPFSQNQSEWLLSICVLPDSAGGLEADPPTKMISGPNSMYQGQAYLVLNSSGTGENWTTVFNSGFNTTSAEHDEWLELRSELPEVGISLSICYTSFTSSDVTVNAYGVSNRTEPVVGWNTSSRTYITDAIRKQLGANKPPVSVEDRGLMALRFNESWASNLGNTVSISLPFVGVNPADVSWWRIRGNQSAHMCTVCTSSNSAESYVHQERIAVFQDILKDTGSPALALQAHFTSLTTTEYYSRREQFDLSSSVNTTSFVSVPGPRAYRGIIIVGTITTSYLVLVFAVGGVFLLSVRFSMLGDCWYTVAQMKTCEAEELSGTTMVTDKGVREWLRDQGKGDLRVKAGMEGGKVRFRAVDRT